jgi:hypothetical protein
MRLKVVIINVGGKGRLIAIIWITLRDKAKGSSLLQQAAWAYLQR